MVSIYTSYTIITEKSGSFVHKLYFGLQFYFNSQINSCYFLKRHSLVGLYKADVVNLTCGRKWIIVCYLENIIPKIFPDIGGRMRCSGPSHAHPNISEFVFCLTFKFLFD